MGQSACQEEPVLSIREIRNDIERRALERQAKIQRGEIDVPIHYFPVSVTTLYDRLAQLDYRTDFLSLAVPPAEPSLLGRFTVAIKALVCRCLRWLLIRQVEFNTVALDHAMESARQLASADQNISELYAAVKAMKLQLHTLSQRLAQLEGERGASGPCLSYRTAETNHASNQGADAPRSPIEDEKHQAFLGYFLERGPVLNIGCGPGGLLRTFLAESFPVKGIDGDGELSTRCKDAIDYLARIEDGMLGGIYLDHVLETATPKQIGDLLGLCWLKLRKGGVLIAETANPAGTNAESKEPVSVDLLTYLVESQCFWIDDQLFSKPLRDGLPACVQSSKGNPYDMKQYRDYAIIGRK
jgi:hypothetical protein